MSAPAAITNEARGLTPGILIELFLLDLSVINSIYTGAPGPTFAFHNSNKQGTDPITFQGIDYQPFPIDSDGWESNSQGQLPKPKVSFSNVGAVGSAMLREFADLHGAKVTRKLTLYKYLDGQPGADPTQEFQAYVYYVDSKAAENSQAVQLVLGANTDLNGVTVPRRPCATSCPFWYRSGEGCDYSGPPVTDQFGVQFVGPLVDKGAYNPASTYNNKDFAYRLMNGVREYSVCTVNGTHANLTTGAGLITDPTHWALDVCIKLKPSCDLRFGANNPVPFGGFPALLRAPSGY